MSANEARILSKKKYLGMALTSGACRKRYGKLLTELQNDYVKGSNNYPGNVVKAYNLLEHYKRDQTLLVQHCGDEGLIFAKIEDEKGED